MNPFASPARKVGITATSGNLTDIQDVVMRCFLAAVRGQGGVEFHHGCCVGGDERGTAVAQWLGYRVIGHPSGLTHEDSRSAIDMSDERRHPRTYRTRDRAIVREVDVLIGLPSSEQPLRNSGTWFTIQCARECRLPRLVVGPTGRVIDHVGVEQYLSLATLAKLGAYTATTDHRLGDYTEEEPA